MQGLTLTVATCVGVRPSLLTLMNFEASSTACVLQVPNWPTAGRTQSPFFRDEDGSPEDRTSKTPSLPGTTEGSAVPMREVKGGLEP